jgi:hypothetical protein
MIQEDAKKIFVTKFSSIGNEKFYKFLLNYAVNRITEPVGISPEIELLDYHDRFLVLYRRENDAIYLDIAKLFRKAGNKIYRIMLKKDLIEKNDRFLNIIK